jgi:general stress protein YciG
MSHNERGHSPAFRTFREYEREIARRGGSAAFATFSQDYITYAFTGRSRSRRYTATFKVIYNRDQNGNELNRLFRRVIDAGRRGFIPNLARPGSTPVYRGFGELFRSGFGKFVPVTDEYNFDRGYPTP